MKPIIIETDDDKYYHLDQEDNQINNNNNNNNNNSDNSDKSEGDTMYLIHNSQPKSGDPIISSFLNFCIKNGFFDNTFYDYKNSFSIIATKLNKTFEKLSENGAYINKNTFITKFKREYGFNGDINKIYKYFDKSGKGNISWDEFLEFFLPFIEFVTI